MTLFKGMNVSSRAGRETNRGSHHEGQSIGLAHVRLIVYLPTRGKSRGHSSARNVWGSPFSHVGQRAKPCYLEMMGTWGRNGAVN